MRTTPVERLQQLPEELKAIRERALRWSRSSHAWDGETLKVLAMPWVAPAASAYWVFEPLGVTPEIEIPQQYATILITMNGFRGLGFDLYGVASQDGRINRKIVRPLCIRAANKSWRYEFEGGEKLFHFGGCELTSDLNGGYFFEGNNIICLSTNGRVTGSWDSFPDFLECEVKRTEALALGNDEILRKIINEI